MPPLFSVHCNTSLFFSLKNSVLRRLLLFSLCGDTMGRSASAMKVRGASQPAFQKVRMKIRGAALPVAKAKAKVKPCSKPQCRYLNTLPFCCFNSSGNRLKSVDAREAVIADVEAFVKKFRRLPKRSSRHEQMSSDQNKLVKVLEEDNLHKRLARAKDSFDDDQQLRYIDLQEWCDATIQDTKRRAWRMLLDDVSQFVRDSRRWPCLQKCKVERFRNLDNPNRSYLKEELLIEKLAKTTKEFDEAHLTELRNLQKDAEQKAVEDLVQEVTELGYWLHSQFNKVSTSDLDYRPSNCANSIANRQVRRFSVETICEIQRFGMPAVKFYEFMCRPSY